MRWDLHNNLTTTNTTFGLGINLTAPPPSFQPFSASNINLLYDGVCASTCALASTMFRHQAHVRSLALGGRPSLSPMQYVGGVKGAQVLTFADIYHAATHHLPLATTPAQVAALSRYSSLPLKRSTLGAVNVRDQIL